MWMEEQGLKCPGCGIPKDLAWPADAKHAREIHGQYKGLAVKCMACSAASEAQERYHSVPHDEHGIHFIIQEQELELDFE